MDVAWHARAVVATVAGASSDRYARMLVVQGVEGGLGGPFGTGIAVRHGDRAHGHGRVDRRSHVRHVIVVSLDEQYVAVGTDGGDHVEIQGDLAIPAQTNCRDRVGRAAVLVHLAKTTVGGGTRRQAELASVGRQIGLCRRQVIRVDYGDRQPRTLTPRRKCVCALKIGRTVSQRWRQGRNRRCGSRCDIRAAECEAFHGAGTCRRTDSLHVVSLCLG